MGSSVTLLLDTEAAVIIPLMLYICDKSFMLREYASSRVILQWGEFSIDRTMTVCNSPGGLSFPLASTLRRCIAKCSDKIFERVHGGFYRGDAEYIFAEQLFFHERRTEQRIPDVHLRTRTGSLLIDLRSIMDRMEGGEERSTSA